VLDDGELCDDGNDIDNDACLSTCEPASCGDGVVWYGMEGCDDQNDVPLDGCEPGCVATEFEMFSGRRHNCMFVADEQIVRCWGGPVAIGQGSTERIGDDPGEMPPPDVEVGGPAKLLAVGTQHGCAVLINDSLRCWGFNQHGQLGHGDTNHIGDVVGEMPPVETDVGGAPVQVELGGAVRCWGDNEFGQLGLGHTNALGDDPGEMPPPIVDVGGPVAELALGNWHTCALLESGQVRCWGVGSQGATGQGNNSHLGDEPGEMPPPNVDYGSGVVVGIRAGWQRTCVILDDGVVRCWGYNGLGQLGQGHTNSIGDSPGEMPPPDVDLGGTVVDLALGLRSSCALLDDGTVRCWGGGAGGTLGSGAIEAIGDDPGEMPPADVELGGPVVRLIRGSDMEHQCVVMAGNGVRCFGKGDYGQLGIGSPWDIGDQPGEMPPMFSELF
jgi:cysteine-rich repeat protein